MGVLIGLRLVLAAKIQPIAQFLAAFPANLLSPVFVVVIVKFDLNPDIWLSPLIVLGTQWYILFNVIAGATSYPNDYREERPPISRSRAGSGGARPSAGHLPVLRDRCDHRVGWSVERQYRCRGGVVGQYEDSGARARRAYIAESTADGDYPKIILGIAVMYHSGHCRDVASM